MKRLHKIVLSATATVTLSGCPALAQPAFGTELPKEDTPNEYLTYACFKALDDTKGVIQGITTTTNSLTLQRLYRTYTERIQEVSQECPEDSKYVNHIRDSEGILEEYVRVKTEVLNGGFL